VNENGDFYGVSTSLDSIKVAKNGKEINTISSMIENCYSLVSEDQKVSSCSLTFRKMIGSNGDLISGMENFWLITPIILCSPSMINVSYSPSHLWKRIHT
jgi:ligand-binding sensor protein